MLDYFYSFQLAVWPVFKEHGISYRGWHVSVKKLADEENQ